MTLSTVNERSTFDPAEWVSQADAARLRGVTRQAIHRLVKRGKLSTLEVGGVRLVRRSEVESYQPAPPGRPAANARLLG